MCPATQYCDVITNPRWRTAAILKTQPPRHFGAARWLSGRASDLRSKGPGFEPRPSRYCATTLGKLFTFHCLIHAILHEEDCELFIKSKTLNHHISVKNYPIWIKFGTLQQILNPMTVT